MLVRVITLRYNPALGEIDDEPLREFARTRQVLTIGDHFFVVDEVPHLTLLITYSSEPLPQSRDSSARASPNQSWRELLTEAQWPLFNALRDWRADRARKDGVPPYVICTNRQFAEMISKGVTNLAELGRIEGFGKAKAEKYARK